MVRTNKHIENKITMIAEIVSKVAEAASEVSETLLDNKFISDIIPSFLKPDIHIGDYQVEAAAKSAGEFFGMPDLQIQKGDSIGVYTMNCDILGDEVLEYNIDQFKDLRCDSFEDMTKIWSHEMGHVILQREYPMGGWVDELGSDFFTGIRSEMLGIGTGNFEKSLGKTTASISHPGGRLRIDAINYGREVAAQMKRDGITPTWQNCIEKFKQSDFAKYTQDNISSSISAFIDDKSYHYGKAADAKHNAEYYSKEAERAAKNGDYARAKDYSQKAASYAKKAEEEISDANRCTK